MSVTKFIQINGAAFENQEPMRQFVNLAMAVSIQEYPNHDQYKSVILFSNNHALFCTQPSADVISIINDTYHGS